MVEKGEKKALRGSGKKTAGTNIYEQAPTAGTNIYEHTPDAIIGMYMDLAREKEIKFNELVGEVSESNRNLGQQEGMVTTLSKELEKLENKNDENQTQIIHLSQDVATRDEQIDKFKENDRKQKFDKIYNIVFLFIICIVLIGSKKLNIQQGGPTDFFILGTLGIVLINSINNFRRI